MRARLTVESGQCLPATLELTPGQPITLGRSRNTPPASRAAEVLKGTGPGAGGH